MFRYAERSQLDKQYKVAVFIGRFQPFHNGHLHVVQEALKQAERLIICVGGAGGARRPRNPWSFQERAQMIDAALDTDSRVDIVPISDHTYNDAAWLQQVQAQVRLNSRGAKDEEIALAGRMKDRSSYYLKMFPQWGEIAVAPDVASDATIIRKRLFEDAWVCSEVAAPVAQWLTEYMATPEARKMREEYKFIAQYRKLNDSGLYHRNNVAADAVVTQAGHVLLVRRRSLPGKGLLALPGGHVDRDEAAFDAMVRELREETGIKVPEAVLRGSVVGSRVFDDPWRSDLVRTYSHAWHLALRGEMKLARLKAGSDAEAAMWVPLSQLYADEMFDDHWHIVRYFTGTGETGR